MKFTGLVLNALLWVLSLGSTPCAAENKMEFRKVSFDDSWQFVQGDDVRAKELSFAGGNMKNVTLPHDWSIATRIDKNAPAGNDGGYYGTGTAWYRKSFAVPEEYAGEKLYLYFEGVYMNSTVYVNGKEVGGHPYGYSSFYCDITDAVNRGTGNLLAVRVDNSLQKNCRWYSGSGIYRHVWLVHCNPVHVSNWGVAVNTKSVEDDRALVEVETTVENTTARNRNVTVVLNVEGECFTSPVVAVPAASMQTVRQTVTVKKPRLWSVETPNLYSLQATVNEYGKVLDRYVQDFGIRTLRFSVDGLFLNGKKVVINGGCMHHDNGILGAAAYDRAEERKVRLMKEAGFNAVRTSHNIPSEAFLDACDRLGLLVIDEVFDGWRDKKTEHDYSALFDKYWQEDVEAMVLRDRRHPAIMAWSVGNEIIERKKIECVTTAHRLAAKVHESDARPVTSALASWDSDWEIYDPLAAEMDVTGYNYMIHKAESDHQRVPGRIMWQTESYPREAFKNWCMVNDHDYIIGDFVWTAMDYLGESGIGRWWYDGDVPGEHYERALFPCHAAYCGDIDLTGWRKPISHYRSMLYNNNEKLYMAVREPDGYYGKIRIGLWAVWPTWECWNWPGHEGKDIDVEVYSRYDKVRLYLNDRLVGEKDVNRSAEFKAVFRLPYSAGTLRAEGVVNGKAVESKTLATASEPAEIRLKVENSTLRADGADLAFVQVEVVDDNGNVCPHASVPLEVLVKGQGTLAAAGNADIKDADPYVDGRVRTWKGRALVVVRSTHKRGKVTLAVKSDGMKEVYATLTSK